MPIENVDKLNVKLTHILNGKVIDKALTKACLLVEGEAKTKCPVDDGTLRASITSEVEGGIGVVGTNVEYAPYVHQGTGIYAVNGDGRKDKWRYQDAEGRWHTTAGQRPQPFLEQALDENKDNILQIFKKTIEREATK